MYRNHPADRALSHSILKAFLPNEPIQNPGLQLLSKTGDQAADVAKVFVRSSLAVKLEFPRDDVRGRREREQVIVPLSRQRIRCMEIMVFLNFYVAITSKNHNFYIE